ncbi:SDR family NAD(P)-dependent oxidoreductase [Arthrobacter sedimenti]|uniref:SDR family NAD(P)-dependent oxidoreductase n=1 Tax=Arthrobacter sedimenti TaxID=2694931 RepID=UPI000B352476|nr:SDR family oxidoreductase [Arthrobacter sedimenti]OUM41716.1 short-chain dehydrogenase [Arthrobacter agilis]
MSEFEGLVAVVTGGSSGIGAATTRLLRQRGASIAVLDFSADETDPADTASAANIAVPADVADDESVRSAITTVTERFGRIDIVVNNAGIGAQGDVTVNDDDEWMRVWNVNVIGIARVTRAALPFLRQSPAASVVNLSSVVATAGLPQRVLYTATKGAVLAMTRAMAADHVREGIRFNAVLPGTVDTPWINRLLADASDPVGERAALEARQPHGRLVTPDEVAGAVAYLASPLSASTTGTSITVDGGLQALRLRSE